MAITLETTYSKKLGLPNYSSHCFIVSLRTELGNLSQVETESARLYALLQQSVDKKVQEVGFLPDATTYGMDGGGRSLRPTPAKRVSGRVNGKSGRAASLAAPLPRQSPPTDAWNCSDKQRDLIQKLGEQANIRWEEIEHIAHSRFDQKVRSLDRKQASVLIGALLARCEEISRTNGSRARQ